MTTTTKTFYLTSVPNVFTSGKRLVITTDRKLGEIKNTTTAKNFFDAKLKFGFELTPIQSDLFE